MAKVKLYLIIDIEGTVYAVSEEPKIIKTYYKQRNFNNKDHQIIKIKRKSLVNSILRDMESLYLTDNSENDIVMTQAEDDIMQDILQGEIYRIHESRTRLESFLDRFILKPSEERSVKKVIKILKEMEQSNEALEEKLNAVNILGGIDDIESLMKIIHASNNIKDIYRDQIRKEGN